MPRIPVFQPSRLPPGTAGGVPMSPGAAAAVPQAIAGVGQQIERSALYAGRVFEQIAEKEALAADTIESGRLETLIKNKSLEVSEGYMTRTDYQNFDKSLEDTLKKLKDEISPTDASPRLQAAFEKAFETQSYSLRHTIKAKKYDVMEKQGKIVFGDIYQQALNDWANEGDQEKKDMIKRELFMKGQTLQVNNAVDPLWIEGMLDKFDEAAKATAINQADVIADKLIENNPAGAADILRDKEFLPALPEKVRQDKVEKATAAKKVFDNELESKRKEALKVAHNDEERAVGDLYMKGEYSKAFAVAQNSKLLTGDEKKIWANSIKEASKEADPFKKTDYEYFWEQLKLAQAGEISNPDAIIPLPNKLSREDANTLRETANRALDPVNKTANEMERKALSAVEEMAKEGSSFFGYTTEDKEAAYNAWSALKLVLDDVKDPGKKIDMLNPKSPNYIVMKTVAPYIKDKNNMNNAQFFIDVLRGVDKKVPPPVKEGEAVYEHYEYNPTTKVRKGWDGEKWVVVPNK